MIKFSQSISVYTFEIHHYFCVSLYFLLLLLLLVLVFILRVCMISSHTYITSSCFHTNLVYLTKIFTYKSQDTISCTIIYYDFVGLFVEKTELTTWNYLLDMHFLLFFIILHGNSGNFALNFQ